MPTFEIEQYEQHTMKYRVEASSEAEAIKKLFAGEAEPVGQSQDFIEVAEDFGLPFEENPELEDKLRALDVAVSEYFIPSVRSIREIE